MIVYNYNVMLMYVCIFITCAILSSAFINTYIVAPYDVMVTTDFYGYVVGRPVVVEHGDILVLNCTASGGPDNMLFWYKDDVLLEGNHENIMELTAVSAGDGGLYECVVNNTAGNSTANITTYGRFYLSLNTLYIILIYMTGFARNQYL